MMAGGVSASTMDKDFNGNGGNVEAATEIGKKIAAKALKRASPRSCSTVAVTFIMAVLGLADGARGGLKL